MRMRGKDTLFNGYWLLKQNDCAERDFGLLANS